ncbi:MAG: hypothetical protein CUN55_13660 [Phototrophicales bacterium]|nr:MAG: hypothetical protein CUN55_13660 [Phototrophicales bacterium]
MPQVFEHRSIIRTTPEQMMAFHEHPKAFQRLTPPPVFIQIHHKNMPSLKDGEVEFTMWMGPVPVRWMARHEPGPIETSFIDRQIKGPLKSWEHQHIFRPTEEGVELIDRITLEHPSGWRGILTRLVFGKIPLRFLFFYRHWRTRLGTQRKTK